MARNDKKRWPSDPNLSKLCSAGLVGAFCVSMTWMGTDTEFGFWFYVKLFFYTAGGFFVAYAIKKLARGKRDDTAKAEE